MRKRYWLSILFLFCFTLTAQAGGSFVVKKIQVEGLQGIPASTVYGYLPVTVGDSVNDQNSSEIIQALYKTGFFDNVALGRDGNTLIIKVVQRPIISRIQITGNKLIPTDKLKESLNTIGFKEGHVFSSSMLENIKSSLKHEYFILGKYNARVDVTVTKEARNRVLVGVTISEGTVATIHQIKIVGNYAFSERMLLRQLKLSTPGLFSWMNHNDQYSREKLEADIETLRSYYMDRGYLRFDVISSQVSITPDHKQVYIALHINEGSQYKISDYTVLGKSILPTEAVSKLIQLQKGQVFSRQAVVAANKRITDALSAQGYANANVKITPKIDDKTKTVFLTFQVVPGPRIYVRYVTFSGHYKTNDTTLRRVLMQFEGSILSPNSVDESKRQLLLLPYIKDVQVSTTPVAGEANQVDVNYNVTEQSAAQLRAGISYSQLEKIMLTFSIDHKNVFGTGNSLSLSAAVSNPSASLSLNYYDPHYTQSGIGRGISAYVSHFNADKADVTGYTTDTYGTAVTYNFPITVNDSFQLGGGYENNLLNTGNSPPNELKNFTNKYGRHFYQFQLNGGWLSDLLDRAASPTAVLSQSASVSTTVPMSDESLEYYKVGYAALYYHPIHADFIGELRGNVDYGNGYGKYRGELPFFKNYYAGGMNSNHVVRGYDDNSLGPLDSQGNPLGGKFAISGSAGLIVPNPLSQNLRTTVFLDGGNAYDGVKLNNLRYAAGLELDWLSPIGLLNFSLAHALNNKKGDDTQLFGFTFGTTF